MPAKPIVITVPTGKRYEAIIAMAHAVEKLASALDRSSVVVHVSDCQFTGVAPAISISPLGPQETGTEAKVVSVEDGGEDGQENGRENGREAEEGRPEQGP